MAFFLRVRWQSSGIHPPLTSQPCSHLLCWLLAALKQSLSQLLPFVRVMFSVCFWRCTWEYQCGSHGSHPEGSHMPVGLQESSLCERARGSIMSPPPSPSGHPRAEHWAQGLHFLPPGLHQEAAEMSLLPPHLGLSLGLAPNPGVPASPQPWELLQTPGGSAIRLLFKAHYLSSATGFLIIP